MGFINLWKPSCIKSWLVPEHFGSSPMCQSSVLHRLPPKFPSCNKQSLGILSTPQKKVQPRDAGGFGMLLPLLLK